MQTSWVSRSAFDRTGSGQSGFAEPAADIGKIGGDGLLQGCRDGEGIKAVKIAGEQYVLHKSNPSHTPECPTSQ